MLSQEIFKANDIRGLAGGADAQWDAEGAYALGVAFVETLDLTKAEGAFVLGRDMRVTGEELSRAFAEGAMSRGADVIDIGLASTDELWFASGRLELPGVQFTASHNPATYNGIKFCLSGARPVTPKQLIDIARKAFDYEAKETKPAARVTGTRREQDLLPAYVDHLHSLVPTEGMRRLKVVVDAGNGMGGHTVPSVLAGLDVEMVGLFLDLDGSFPNHQPNPLEPENLVDAQRAVRDNGADLALVFDGDADRCFIIDETGAVVNPSAVTALIACQELRREPGSTIVINTITSRTVAEVVAEEGGETVVSRVGHTYVKAAMAERDAIFGGEHSAHYYFRDFWSADTGMLAGLHVLAMLGRSDEPLSRLVQRFDRYASSGEINSTVADAKQAMDKVAEAFAGRGEVGFPDGLMVNGPDWWVNLRPSNTEPLLRLNVEAKDPKQMAALRDEVLALVRGQQ
ncbi:phosphohexomutase domain-containing protein [Enemella evansiae]|uniref:Phosphomannomutase/phosphoglucomutase n=1 Tax=Enemella evansiae TaxID=2016499 RepID=A0A255FY78_9ACTN|nr:phosphomannomutase/phosphoglucomutase [Enemella evansiae]OYO04399.1 phosphomannomutase/phosphoglucomutase [Enemella evansiae]OYO06338.1 phosphomannomutase/phosphoglucomutase [Enemella evansiae]OYO07125.1 phosphomannomutase/phosphoglucomutase [Enemella evansiae]OYO08629.1 phosphomannomutase/phosphoglucomutase [Enemella evansiae]